ncbi:MAG: hypothetical protein A2651_04030 [Candidatus Yanofskybacteria bacterium RIFCSPHIGHO2_01_FULL_42_12]|nr:MAG: hypothetical protein A2651_04030 [Candidatus Yanofskybacteria bacterium RIFCSPHIGHO2_01_FULL_42_12]
MLERIFCRLGYQKIVPNGITRENFFDMYFSLKRPFVVQIGTNDGKTYDPLYRYISKYQLPGLMVEPQEEVFERLKSNYKDNPNLKFANVAIGDKDGEAPFYRIKPSLVMDGKEYKASSGSSFYRDDIVLNVKNRLPPVRNNVLHHISDDPNDYIERISIKIITISSLFREYGIDKIDFLLTDCQGYDSKILNQFDFRRFSPDIINFEHSLITPEELLQSRALLEREGYKYFIHEADICAYKAS